MEAEAEESEGGAGVAYALVACRNRSPRGRAASPRLIGAGERMEVPTAVYGLKAEVLMAYAGGTKQQEMLAGHSLHTTEGTAHPA